jgi:hypothetical protein
VTDLAGVNGAYPLDVDGDGNVDLAVLRTTDTTLLRGVGGCRFEPADERWSFAHDGYATAFSASWETPAAALPTLAVGDYLGLDGRGLPTLECDPANDLYRPAGGDRYAPPIALTPGWCALSMLFSDWDRSGRRDLRVSNDRHYYDFDHGEEQLWRVAPGEPPRLYGPADGWVQVQIEGMGIASYDLTDDGYPDVYLTSQGSNRLQALASGPPRPVYQDIGLKRNVNLVRPFTGPDTSLPSTAWHPEFEDVNNDGLVDLFVSKGNVGEQPDYARQDPSNLLLQQPDGTFVEVADRAGVLSMDRGRGAALADLNLDGLLDLVEVNLGSPVRLWRNLGAGGTTGGGGEQRATPMGHWLAVTVRQPGPNRDAIGGWLEIKVEDRVTRRELTVGGGHVSGQLGPIHVGLGSATSASVRVTWPDGQVGPWLPASADGFVIVDRATGTLQPWTPPAS